jgi:serine/threonine protein kinase
MRLSYEWHRYEIIDTAEDLFVVMEYVSGGELFDFLYNTGKVRGSSPISVLMDDK